MIFSVDTRHLELVRIRNCNYSWLVDDDGVGGRGTQYCLAVLSLSEGRQLQIGHT